MIVTVVDQLVWTGGDKLELVIQCKGFKVSERELGPSQVKQCAKSIRSFAKSGQKANVYLLTYNRRGKNDHFKKEVSSLLHTLETTGQVKRVELWDCDKLIKMVAKALRQKILNYISNQHTEKHGDALIEEQVEVPFRDSTYIVDRHRLKTVGKERIVTADPALEMIAVGSGVDARAILLGEAGYGKTTAALRAVRSAKMRIFFMRAAALTGAPNNRSTFIEHFAFVDEFLTDILPEDLPTIQPLARASMESVFNVANVPALLVIDGLDESIALSRRGGLQWLFNIVKTYELPVIFTSRTEFWHSRKIDFATAIGLVAPEPGTKQRKTRVKLIELLPWNEEQIVSFAERFRNGLADDAERDRVEEFIQLVRSDQYGGHYGDIPKRPLFLKFILDTVAKLGIHQVSKVELVEEWARNKIIRDYSDPLKYGVGRPSILPDKESIDITVRLAFCGMMRAAASMSKISNGKLEMLPCCPIDEVLAAEPSLRNINDPLGLFLNSLLVPVEGSGFPTIVRFGHQVYQEFFLAKFIECHRTEFMNVTLPDRVQQWFR